MGDFEVKSDTVFKLNILTDDEMRRLILTFYRFSIADPCAPLGPSLRRTYARWDLNDPSTEIRPGFSYTNNTMVPIDPMYFINR